MPASTYCTLLLAVTALCCFGIMDAFLIEGINLNTHCRCLGTTDSRINTRQFQRIEIVPAGPYCRRTEIIITLKDKKVVCVEPEAEWIQKLISKIVKRTSVRKREVEP